MYTLDIKTFGDEPCCVNLAKILNEKQDNKVRRKIGSLLAQYCYELSHIDKITDKTIVQRLAVHSRNHYLKVIELSKYEKVVYTHLRCSIITKCRKLLRKALAEEKEIMKAKLAELRKK